MYYCTNGVIRDPGSGAVLKQCGYHTKTCGMTHPGNSAGGMKIEHPNKDALCDSHYVAKNKHKPGRFVLRDGQQWGRPAIGAASSLLY